MSISDRSNQKPNDVSNATVLSDRNIHREEQNNQNSKIDLPNEEVQSIKSSKKSEQSESTKRKRSILANIIHYIVPQTFLNKQACPICEQSYVQNQLRQFGSCGHSFCQPCIKQYVQFKLNNSQLITCPLENCTMALQKRTIIYDLVMSEQDRLKYGKIQRNLQILGNPHLKSCINQHCHGILNLHDIKLHLQTNPKSPIICPQCQTQYCGSCLQKKHEGECQKQTIKFLQRNKKFRQCTKCKRVIQKSQGCTHMTCLCGFYFCYMCGEELQPGIHECKVPQNLNCLQKVRWDIQHRELFYESNYVSFHKYLYCFQLSADKPMIVRALYSVLYTLTIYPLSIVLGLLLAVLFFVLLFVILLLIFLFLPLSQLCTQRDYCITQAVQDICGYFGLVMCMLVFYPVFIVSIMVEALKQVFKDEQTPEQLCIVFSQIGLGLRNLLAMPFVLCVHPQTLDTQRALSNRVQN